MGHTLCLRIIIIQTRTVPNFRGRFYGRIPSLTSQLIHQPGAEAV